MALAAVTNSEYEEAGEGKKFEYDPPGPPLPSKLTSRLYSDEPSEKTVIRPEVIHPAEPIPNVVAPVQIETPSPASYLHLLAIDKTPDDPETPHELRNKQ